MMRVEALKGERAAHIKLITGFDPDDAMVVVPLAGVFDWMEPLLWAAFIGTPVFALVAYRLYWRDLMSRRIEKS
jgi:hypothetical protein